MIAILLALATDSATVCVTDASSGAPVAGVQAVDASGHVRVMRSSCTMLPAVPFLLRRVGYRAQRVSPIPGARLVVRLVALRDVNAGASPAVLDTQQVRESVPRSGWGAERGVARVTADVSVEQSRERGASSTSGLVASLPFAAARSARGETGLSLRGARREQVGITLDGMPLNDPATGIADVSDLPLVALGGATLVLGADPIGAGPGTGGGVLALRTAAANVLSAGGGAFGERRIEGAARTGVGALLLHGAASYRSARNDFPFINDAGADGPVREDRVNNDEQRTALSVGAIGARVQAFALASVGERGLVGAANVRSYDTQRARARRMLLRTQAMLGGAEIIAGARGITLAYQDPTQPSQDAHASAEAADVETRAAVPWLRGLSWRAGAGGDRLRATGGVAQSRTRGFAATAYAVRGGSTTLDAGVRVDVVSGASALPSFSLAAEHALAGRAGDVRTVTLGARVAQAVRVPTLYDLYFSAPQRLFVRSLASERVTHDAEVNVRAAAATRFGRIGAQGALVSRATRDAIVWFPGNFGWSPANVGRETLRGAEARAALESRALALSAWLTAYESELHSGALRIPTPYVPRIAGGARVGMRRGALSGTASWRVNGPRPFTAGPRDPAFELPAVGLLDAALSHRAAIAGADAQLVLAVDNLTDVSWQSVRGFPSPGRAWSASITLSPASSR